MAWKSYGKRLYNDYADFATQKYNRPVHRMANKAADWFQKITGFGDYQINNNTLMTDNAPPTFHGSNGGLRICHREYVKDILSSQSFNHETFTINAGNVSLFPWLSTLTQNFEQYVFNGLILEFRSTAGSAIASTNNALGVVVMSTDYDVYDDEPSSKAQMQQTMFCCSGSPVGNLIHPIECDPAELATKLFYIDNGNTTETNRDQRFQDMGNFTIATQGMQADDINIGELWVSYDVTLLKPQSPAIIGQEVRFELTGVDTTNPLGTSYTTTGSGVAGILPIQGTNEFYIDFDSTHNQETWLIMYNATGTSTGSVTIMTSLLTNCTTYNFASTSVIGGPTGTTSRKSYVIGVTMGDSPSGSTVTIQSNGVFPASITSASLRLIRINAAF